MRHWLRAWADETGDTTALGIARVCIGLLLLRHADKLGQELLSVGHFADDFHLSFLPEILVPSRAVYLSLIGLMVLGSVLAIIGHRARMGLFVTSSIAMYVGLCDRLALHNNHYALFCFGFLLSFTPCDRTLVWGRARTEERSGPLWAQRLVQLQLSIIYFASGGGKLLDPDWRDGLVIANRIARHAADGWSPGIVEWLSRPDVAGVLAKIAIATELGLAIGLWHRRTRIYALWWGVMFHLTIELTSKVQAFTWLTLAVYALFATPDYRARRLVYDSSSATARWCARGVRALDWLARFETIESEHGPFLRVINRDGSIVTGLQAMAMVARCLPLGFPLWPLLGGLALLRGSNGRRVAPLSRQATSPTTGRSPRS